MPIERNLEGKHIVVAVGGGIAAFKAVELVRELTRRGAELRVVMTPSATRFVGPVTFTGLTGKPAVVDLWDPSYAGEVHVELAAWADAIVVAPATANMLARASIGMADDAVLATIACCDRPILYAPAMHTRMWRQKPTRRAVEQLSKDGAQFVGPVVGKLASGDVGEGRMSEPGDIANAVEGLFAAPDLAGRAILITAGPTVEDLDPVRFIGNRSTGKMGYALAERASKRGAKVTLVSGPVSLAVPTGVELVSVRSALEMRDAVRKRARRADAVIMAAAVSDYRPIEKANEKIKKSGDVIAVELTKNPDILADLGKSRRGTRPVLVGFAVETTNVVEYARKKLKEKRVDFVVANEAKVGFAGDNNEVTLVFKNRTERLPNMPKLDVADHILGAVRTALGAPKSRAR